MNNEDGITLGSCISCNENSSNHFNAYIMKPRKIKVMKVSDVVASGRSEWEFHYYGDKLRPLQFPVCKACISRLKRKEIVVSSIMFLVCLLLFLLMFLGDNILVDKKSLKNIILWGSGIFGVTAFFRMLMAFFSNPKSVVDDYMLTKREIKSGTNENIKLFNPLPQQNPLGDGKEYTDFDDNEWLCFTGHLMDQAKYKKIIRGERPLDRLFFYFNSDNSL